MATIRQVVARQLAPPALAGGKAATGFDRNALLRELRRVQRSREIAFWLCAAALVVVFLAAIAFVISNRDRPDAIKKMSTATGITLLGVIAAMIKLWQDRVKADLVTGLVAGMGEEALKDALTQLLAKL